VTLFERPTTTYDVPQEAVDHILKDNANPLLHIARSLPNDAAVLDIGSGSGLLPLISSRLGRHTVFDAVEPNEYAAKVARPRYRDYHVGHVADCPFLRAGRRYDFFVLADVLEHTTNPEAFLHEILGYASPQTRILLSVPNVAFIAVRIALLNGDFDYVDSGILERTHLRFFTRKTIETLVSGCSLHISRLCLLQRDPYGTEVDVGQYSIRPTWRLARDELALTYQFLLELSQSPCEARIERYRAARSGGLWTLLRRARRRFSRTGPRTPVKR
jgi:2-polyprenyl-3-methyl-5-hydroxy-6-metoxy-1,4-benzoquinol methylase